MYSHIMKSFAVMLLLSSITLTACKKDKDKSRTDLLTEKPWKVDVSGIDNNDNGIVDSDEDEIEDCDRDDTHEFKTDHTVIFQDNAIKCGPTNDDEGIWAFADNEQKLVLSLSTEMDTVNIKTLDENVLEIYYVYPDGEKLIHKFKH